MNTRILEHVCMYTRILEHVCMYLSISLYICIYIWSKANCLSSVAEDHPIINYHELNKIRDAVWKGSHNRLRCEDDGEHFVCGSATEYYDNAMYTRILEHVCMYLSICLYIYIYIYIYMAQGKRPVQPKTDYHYL